MWSYWKVGLLFVVVAVVAFAAYLGGPLYFTDALESVAGRIGSVAIGSVPVLVAGICAFSLWESHPWNMGKYAVALGLLGVAVISAMNTFTVMQLLTTPLDTDSELTITGVSVGGACALLYLALAYRRFRRAAVQA